LVYLKKIETKGFKSMGPSLVNVPVERGLVAITGPNGSGKSNILDAILFCLGENSAKTLRVPSLSQLIYDAPPDQQRPSSARVSLQFENADRRIPVDYDSVTITRELKSTGESVYFLNGKHIQRNNLSEILEMALITSRGLNIVLQGMITRISELVPDEKRKLVEQMVGVAQFDEKKEEALKQLQDADNKLAVAMAKIEEIKDQVQQLEEQRNDQLRLKQLEDLVKWLRAVSASGKISNLRGMSSSRREAQEKLEARFHELEADLAATKLRGEEAERERSELLRSSVDSGTAQIEAEMGAIKSELLRVKALREESTKLIGHLRQVLPAIAQMKKENEDKIYQSEIRISDLQRKIASAQESRNAIISSQSDLAKEREKFDAELLSAQNRLNKFRKQKEIYDGKLARKRIELNDVTSKLELSRTKLSGLRERSKFLTESLANANRSIDDLESILQGQRDEISRIQESKGKVENFERKVEAHLEIALQILEKAQTAVIKYDSDLSAIENVAPDEVALARLEALGEEGKLEGFYGIVSKIIDYAPIYSHAIAALGRDWLNAIVAKDVESLTKIAALAKGLGISRLTVIPLEEVSESQAVKLHRKGKRNSSKIKPASEVVSCESKFRGIVNFIFGDAFVVQSAKQAFVVARKGLRAVTLRGDVFEPDILAFETGYSKRFRKIEDILGQQESFEGIRLALSALRNLIEKRKSSLSELRLKSKEYAGEIGLQGLDLSRTEGKIESVREAIANYARNAEALNERARETESEIAALEKDLRRVERVVFAFEAGSKKLGLVIEKFDLSSFDSRLQDLNRRRAEIESQFNAVNSEIMEVTNELTRERGNLENNLKPGHERLHQQIIQSEEKLAASEEFLKTSEPKLAELQEKFDETRKRELEILEKANKFKSQLEAADDALRKIKAEEERLNKLLFSTERDLDSCRADLARIQEIQSNLTAELSMLGYAEPVETFEGADSLLKELNSEAELLRGNVNNLADQTYRDVFDNYKNSSLRHNELEKERNAIVTFIERIDADKRKVFVDAYDRINRELGSIFKKMTTGSAWLELEKPDDIFSGGIFLMTQFPNQLARDSTSVSGGQKTVAALSFIMAIQAVFPSPFYVFDEVDAALDNVYSGKMAEILAERSAYSQIIMVSLKDSVVSKASTVIGVYMSLGCSRVLRYTNPMEVKVASE
jgi:chromosome segregation protein